MTVMIAVIPITVGMPAVAVFVPPTVPLVPAAFPRFAQFVPRMVRLPAVPAVIFDSFVQPVVRLGDAALATIIVIGGCPRRSREGQHSQKRC
jgi:hypothetical protein